MDISTVKYSTVSYRTEQCSPAAVRYITTVPLSHCCCVACRVQVYGPLKDDAYGTLPFPALGNAITSSIACKAGLEGTAGKECTAGVQREVHRLARAITRVTSILEGKIN